MSRSKNNITRNLIVDLSNIVFVSYFANKNEFTKGLLIHKVIENMLYMFREYKPDAITIACDSPNVWRRDLYTEYKASRELNRDENYEEVKEVMIELKDFFNTCTNIRAISIDRCEADDIIAVFSELSKKLGYETIIYSNDRDFFQLLDESTSLHSPIKDKGRINYDISNREYDLFMKCIRGDRGDNIFSAYPRVRETKIKQAWGDKVEYLNFMETIPKNMDKRVSEMFALNKSLIDLSMIPDNIRTAIKDEFQKRFAENMNYDFVKVGLFMGRYSLKKIMMDLNQYAIMFKSGKIIL